MATKDFNFKDSRTRRRLRSTAIGPYIDGFTTHLEHAGYCASVICDCLCAATHLAFWMQGEGIAVSELRESALTSFAGHFPCSCFSRNPGQGARVIGKTRHLLEYLRESGVVASEDESQPASDQLELADGFVHWLRVHRGLRDLTISGYRRVVVDLLAEVGNNPSQFQVRNLRAFVLDRAKRHRSPPKTLVAAVRMFLRYLIAEGKCAPGLDDGIPSVAQWRLSSLPRYVSASDVERIVQGCDVATPVGCRDRAVVLLVARLGLRAGDVARLRVADIDWDHASLLVAGKERRAAWLPLPQDVGDALLRYLERARPPVQVDQVFIRSRAPLRPLGGADAICAIIARAIRRAGVQAPSQGAHLLRHSLATNMLGQGSTLQEIGTVLRHRSVETTASYAKVDVHALQSVAQPWPEAVPC